MPRAPADLPSRTSGTLYVVSTPIGNLRDLTLRALDTLRQVRLVAAEDTRHTRKLLTAFGLRCALVSLHAHSQEGKILALIDRVVGGEDLALVTDAGCPTISDPGSQLVDAAHRAGVPVRVIPGPSAITAALALSGLPASDFRFLGFLPRQRGRRLEALRAAALSGSALVLFESPGRARALLEELEQIMGDRQLAICRELTKLHEEVLRGTASELAAALPEEPRGEFTFVVASGAPSKERASLPTVSPLDRARALRDGGLSPAKTARALASELGISRKEAYALVLEVSEEKPPP